MKFLSSLLAVGLILGLSSAQAAEKKKGMVDSMSGQGYGMAGCGAGSIVFGDKEGKVQIFASTTNGTAYNQSFGITSGTSNCGSQGKSAKVDQFVETNKVALQNDIARGQGETLASFSQLLECKNSGFQQNLRSAYTSSFPQGGASAGQIQAVAYKVCEI
ncbi:MAG: DUF3015 family protein [Bdellovibrionota bacterium]